MNLKTIYFRLLVSLVVILMAGSSFGQLTLPSQDVIKKNNVRSVDVIKCGLSPLALDSSQTNKQATPDDSFLWARYWFNETGLPDSMYNFMKGIAYRKELFQYTKSGQIEDHVVCNDKGESVSKTHVYRHQNGTIQYETQTKGALTSVKLCDPNNHLLYSKIITKASIMGYDSVVYRDQLKPNVQVETYYLAGIISHQLTSEWIGSGPDSFYQTFYQSNNEDGRLPSYRFGFEVNADGSLVIPPNQALPSLFQNISFNKRHREFNLHNQEIDELLTGPDLAPKSQTYVHSGRYISRHYFSFHYEFY